MLQLDLQGLAVGGEARDAHQSALVHLEDALEVAVHRHELSGQARVACDGHAVLALHGNHRVSVVLVLHALSRQHTDERRTPTIVRLLNLNLISMIP